LKVEVFDDWFSLGHFVLGALTPLSLLFFVAYFFYQLIEFFYKYPRKEEKIGNFVGDLIEFLMGVSFSALIIRGWVSGFAM